MTDVLLGQAYHLRLDPKLWDEMRPYPPLGSLYAAAVLREAGHDVAFHDAMLDRNLDGWARALDRHRPTIAVLFEDSFNYLTKMCLLRMREAAFEMIEAARSRGARVLVAGSDATDRADLYLERGADAVLLGEAEGSLCEAVPAFLEAPRRSAPHLGGIEGVAWPGGSTGRRRVLRSLDALPVPAWDLVDLNRYRRIWRVRHGRFSLNLATSRGCPYHCNWCAKPIWGQRYTVRSPERVADEMAFVAGRYGVEHVWFADDIMGLKPGWLVRFADAVSTRGLRLPFKCLSRADLLLRDGDVAALARAGCESVWLGAESGSQKILDAMEKGTTVDEIREATRRLRDAGIRVGFFLQFGYPGETRADIEATRALVRETGPDDIGVSVSYPLPGTPFHERVQGQLGEKQNWLDSDDLAMMYDGPFSTGFYRQLHRVVTKEFRIARARTDLRSSKARTPRRAAALGYHTLTLPLERWRLARRDREPHAGIGAIGGQRSREEAATPTPSSEVR